MYVFKYVKENDTNEILFKYKKMLFPKIGINKQKLICVLSDL